MLGPAILTCMVRTYPPLPPRDDLLELFQESLANAGDLISEAELLAGGGRFPRAHVLATFGHEEIGKAQLCLLAIMLDEITPREFWDAFNSHQGKLMRVDGFGRLTSAEPVTLVSTFVPSVVDHSAAAHSEKLAGLYVDYQDGAVQLPSKVTEKAAARQIESARNALALAERAFPLDTIESFLAVVPRLVPALKKAHAEDADALLATLQRAVQGSTESLQELLGEGPADSTG